MTRTIPAQLMETARWLGSEGTICSHQANEAEKKALSLLVRRGCAHSSRGDDGCRHYTFIKLP